MTRLTLLSLPGMAWLDRIDRVVLAELHATCSRRGRAAPSADIGSPCEPVEMMQTLPGLVLVDVVDVDHRRLGDVEHAELASEADVLLHAQPEGGDDAPVGDRGVGDLLDAVQVAGEAGGDDPAVAVARRTTPAARLPTLVSLGE